MRLQIDESVIKSDKVISHVRANIEVESSYGENMENK